MEQITDKLLSWASIIDEKTLEQAKTASTMPFIHPHLALMSDAHLGKGATVGSVIPTLGAIIPAAVGVDIGCGMIAIRTTLTVDQLPADRKPLREAIEWAIPLSAGRYNNKIVATAEPKIAELEDLADNPHGDHRVANWWGGGLDAFVPNWRNQLGSLGSGNHFIEVTVDEEERVWLFLHSGSRGVGNKLAQWHIKVAQELCAKRYITLPDRDLAYLVEGDLEFEEYITDLQWAQRFAFLNREEMMDRVVRQFSEWVGVEWDRTETINCHHNYSTKEVVCSTCIDIQNSDNQLREHLLADYEFARVRDCLGSCRLSVHSCGGLLLTAEAGDRVPAASRDGVLESIAVLLRWDPGHRRTHSASFDLCGCEHPDRTDVASSTALNRFGQGFYRLVSTGTERHRLDTVLVGILSGVSPHIQCTPGHDKTPLWLSRKGAIDAHEGVAGLIPGSMGTASYAVVGKGNRAALCSSPHGAGRVHSRTSARKTFTLEQLQEDMKGIEWSGSKAFLDEIPAAYKDVEVVMQDAADLVEIKHEFHQIVNVKGD